MEVGIRGPHLGLARKLQRVEIRPGLIAPRLGFAHPIVPDEAVEQFPAKLKADAPRGSLRVKIRAVRPQVQAI